jgi:hypothetical protein
VTTIVVFVVLGITDLQHQDAFLLAIAAAVGLVILAVLTPWRRLPSSAQASLPLAFFAVIVLLRDAGGGGISGVGAMVLLPVGRGC